jgi:hypothetical protein
MRSRAPGVVKIVGPFTPCASIAGGSTPRIAPALLTAGAEEPAK